MRGRRAVAGAGQLGLTGRGTSRCSGRGGRRAAARARGSPAARQGTAPIPATVGPGRAAYGRVIRLGAPPHLHRSLVGGRRRRGVAGPARTPAGGGFTGRGPAGQGPVRRTSLTGPFRTRVRLVCRASATVRARATANAWSTCQGLGPRPRRSRAAAFAQVAAAGTLTSREAAPAATRQTCSKASGGGQEQTRCRSP